MVANSKKKGKCNSGRGYGIRASNIKPKYLTSGSKVGAPNEIDLLSTSSQTILNNIIKTIESMRIH